jgi:uncharacterized RDD family membrane protein YckC
MSLAEPIAPAQAAAAAPVYEPARAEAGSSEYAGLITRAIAFAIDAAIVDIAGLFVAAVVGLALSVIGAGDHQKTLLVAIGGALFVAWTLLYFVVFWSTTGETPGNRVMRIRVRPADGSDRFPPRRAAVRLVGLVLAALPLMLGFVPILFDDRRRGLQDWLARTVVVYVDDDSDVSGRGRPTGNGGR